MEFSPQRDSVYLTRVELWLMRVGSLDSLFWGVPNLDKVKSGVESINWHTFSYEIDSYLERSLLIINEAVLLYTIAPATDHTLLSASSFRRKVTTAIH